MKKKAFYLLLFLAMLLASAIIGVALTQAGQVTLSWDPNSPTPAGYRVYQRLEGGTYNYSAPAWPLDNQNHTETTCTITGLEEGQTYYFVVRAYVGADESGDSNEVAYLVPESGQPPDNDTAEPTNLTTDQIATQLHRIETNQATILEILAGGQPQDPAPTTPYCGNPDSKILHRSTHWCGTNAVPFNTTEEATAAGYRPCGVCKP
jgi:hypothetical protein